MLSKETLLWLFWECLDTIRVGKSYPCIGDLIDLFDFDSVVGILGYDARVIHEEATVWYREVSYVRIL